jgi:hypothetical protein
MQLDWAFPLFASPKQASAMPARPRPNFFSAARRVTDWAICFVSSSNLLFMLSFCFWFVFVFCQRNQLVYLLTRRKKMAVTLSWSTWVVVVRKSLPSAASP